MGIPHLISYLKPFATREPLDAEVVLDGPGFAYHIYHLAVQQCYESNDSLDRPSYAKIAHRAVSWLSGLEEHGVTITKIIFDGLLPDDKLPLRLERLRETTQRHLKYHNSNPVPTARPRATQGQSDSRAHTSAAQIPRKRSWLKPPVASFLVPTVIDALKSSPKYRQLVELVPGEADTFCAKLARSRRCCVLTSDSDLLVYLHDSDSSVAFFEDIDVTIPAAEPRAAVLQYTTGIRGRLGLAPGIGIPRIAYELLLNPHASLEQLVRRTSQAPYPKDRKNYADFISRYRIENPNSSSSPTFPFHQGLQQLDPRVSEIVLSAVSGRDGLAETSQEKTINMFLPFLLDNPQRSSAWEAALPIRRLAYSILLELAALPNAPSIVEFRRLQVGSRGRGIAVPGEIEREAIASSLVRLLESSRQVSAGRTQQLTYFTTLSELQETGISVKPPLGLMQLQLAFSNPGSLTPLSWDTIHLAAQVQACVYSLRMLRQILGLNPLPFQRSVHCLVTARELLSHLEDLPGFESYPRVEEIPEVLDQLVELGAFALLAGHLSVPEPALYPTTSQQRRNDRIEETRAPGERPSTSTILATSKNFYSVLAGE